MKKDPYDPYIDEVENPNILEKKDLLWVVIILTIIALTLLGVKSVFAVTSTHSTDLERTSNQYWSINDAAQTGLDITGDMTMMGYFKPEAQPANEQPFSIYSKYLGTGNQRALWVYWRISGGVTNFSWNQSSDGSAVTTKNLDQAFTNGTWYHVAFVYTAATGVVEVFVDGTSVGTMTALPTSIFNSSAAARIGGEPDADGFKWDGLLDDYMIFNAVLTEAQIDTYISDECDWTPLASLQARWLFDNDGLDDTANNNDLTNNNSATFSTDKAYTCAVA